MTTGTAGNADQTASDVVGGTVAERPVEQSQRGVHGGEHADLLGGESDAASLRDARVVDEPDGEAEATPWVPTLLLYRPGAVSPNNESADAADARDERRDEPASSERKTKSIHGSKKRLPPPTSDAADDAGSQGRKSARRRGKAGV